MAKNASFAVSSSSSIARWKYDVFLSFRGEDTRKNFVSHLYNTLRQKGIVTFKDDRELERGKNISEYLIRGIENSRFAVIVFSQNYADSPWCLDELATIFRCAKQDQAQTVLPVFYDVKPSEVKNQSGRFRNAFDEHEHTFRDNIERVESWRVAMAGIANMSGWDLCERDETEFIQDIVEEILSKLRKSSSRFSSLAKDFVGMDSRLEKLTSFLDVGRKDDVRIVGIWGMGGIGKTTIARIAFEKLSRQFECSCFLPNIRETNEKHGLAHLQETLLHQTLLDRNLRIWDIYKGMDEIRHRLCSRRVLVVLDDIDQPDELKSLAGTSEWFGSGSRIIITTRDEHLLICHGVEEIYRAKMLDNEEAVQLLRSKAFKNCCPTEEHLELCQDVVKYANGLPLALDVLGCFLCGRSINEWRSALSRLKEIPNKKILEKLEISFDGLDEMDQKIFLDIACFFSQQSLKFIRRILKGCGFFPDIGLKVLVDKSLVSISGKTVIMHDLLQEMGREIVRRQAYEEPGKRSRLWLFNDIQHVLVNDTGTEQVEGVVLNSQEKRLKNFNEKAFLKMRKLRLLKLRSNHIPYGLGSLSSELRYLDLDGYSLKSLPSSFQLCKLVELRMTCSKIEQFWIKTKPLDTLKVLNLYDSSNLIKIGGFNSIPNLKTLILEGCKRLVEIHESIGILKRLVDLNLRNCRSLMQLPNSICDLTSLKALNLDGCSKLEQLPERFCDIPCLEDISVSGVMKYSESEPTKPWDFLFGRFSKKKINPIAFMLPSFSTLSSLKQLNLSNCNLSEEVIPTDLGGFPSLETLNLSGNDFVNIPTNLIQLFKLEKVCFMNCKRLRVLPDLPSNITCLRVDGCSSLEAYPNPCQKLTFKPWMFTFVNCLKLNDTPGAFAWLRSYLYFLLYSNLQGIRCMEYDFTMLLPGSRIPDCFNHQEDDSSMKLQLPQNWCENKWMGFLVCALFGPDVRASSTSLSSSYIRCDLLAGPELNNLIFQDATRIYIGGGTRINSDQLWLIFIPRDNTRSLDWWKSLNHFEVSFSPYNLKVKRCGVRLVHEEDIEEFVQCTKPSSQNNQLAASSSDQDYCIVNGNEGRESEVEEPSGSSNSVGDYCIVNGNEGRESDVEEPSGSSNSVGESPYPLDLRVPTDVLTSMTTVVYSSKHHKTSSKHRKTIRY